METKSNSPVPEAWDLMVPEAPPDESPMDPFDGLTGIDGLDLGGNIRYPKKSKKRSDFSPSNPRILNSALHLLPNLEGGNAPVDELCRFRPWNRTAYITYCVATVVDFSQFLWLLQNGRPASWYKLPSHKLPQAPNSDGGDPLPHSGSPMMGAEPSALTYPRVCIGSALRSVPVSEPQPIDVATPISASGTLRYLSVVQAVQHVGTRAKHHSSYYPEAEESNSDCGVPLYKLVVTGSRESALAQAFYDAGANGWATMFTCVVFDKGLVEHSVADLGPESIRVSSLADLTSVRNRKLGGRLVLF